MNDRIRTLQKMVTEIGEIEDGYRSGRLTYDAAGALLSYRSMDLTRMHVDRLNVHALAEHLLACVEIEIRHSHGGGSDRRPTRARPHSRKG